MNNELISDFESPIGSPKRSFTKYNKHTVLLGLILDSLSIILMKSNNINFMVWFMLKGSFLCVYDVVYISLYIDSLKSMFIYDKLSSVLITSVFLAFHEFFKFYLASSLSYLGFEVAYLFYMILNLVVKNPIAWSLSKTRTQGVLALSAVALLVAISMADAKKENLLIIAVLWLGSFAYVHLQTDSNISIFFYRFPASLNEIIVGFFACWTNQVKISSGPKDLLLVIVAATMQYTEVLATHFSEKEIKFLNPTDAILLFGRLSFGFVMAFIVFSSAVDATVFAALAVIIGGSFVVVSIKEE